MRSYLRSGDHTARAAIGVIAGGGLMVVGWFLPWLPATDGGTVDGSMVGSMVSGPVVPALGLLLVGIGVLLRARPGSARRLGALPVTVGVLGLLVAGYTWAVWQFAARDLTTGNTLQTIVVGGLVAAIGALVATVSAALAWRRGRRSTAWA